MIENRTYRVLAGLLTVLLLAGNGLAMGHCQMQMTSEHSSEITVMSRMSGQNMDCCTNTTQQSKSGQFSHLMVCNCKIPVRPNTEILTSPNVHFNICFLFTSQDNKKLTSNRKQAVRHELPFQSSDEKPIYLRNSIFLI